MGRSSHAGTVSQVQLLVGSKFQSYNTAPAVSNFPAVYIASVLQNGNETIRLQPEGAGLYEARETTYMYSGRHDDILTDYSLAIELDPANAGLWRRRSHAHTITPTPQPEKGVENATHAIELDPVHPMGYGYRAVAFTQLTTPDWQNALADMNRHIELFPRRDPEALGCVCGSMTTWGTTRKPSGTRHWPINRRQGKNDPRWAAQLSRPFCCLTAPTQ